MNQIQALETRPTHPTDEDATPTNRLRVRAHAPFVTICVYTIAQPFRRGLSQFKTFLKRFRRNSACTCACVGTLVTYNSIRTNFRPLIYQTCAGIQFKIKIMRPRISFNFLCSACTPIEKLNKVNLATFKTQKKN